MTTRIAFATSLFALFISTAALADDCKLTIVSPNASYRGATLQFVPQDGSPSKRLRMERYPKSRVVFADPQPWLEAKLRLKAGRNYTFVLPGRQCGVEALLLTSDKGTPWPFLRVGNSAPIFPMERDTVLGRPSSFEFAAAR